MAIISSSHWDKAMRMCTENNITPMRLLIEFMPGIGCVMYDCFVTILSTYLCMHCICGIAESVVTIDREYFIGSKLAWTKHLIL